jgi:hypothetical protein
MKKSRQDTERLLAFFVIELSRKRQKIKTGIRNKLKMP